MARLLRALMLCALLSGSASSGATWAAPLAASCTYTLGFAALHDLIPERIGACVTDAAPQPNGDVLQQTENGLLAWRKADNWTAFTDGSSTWISGPCGLQSRPNTILLPWEAGNGCTESVEQSVRRLVAADPRFRDLPLTQVLVGDQNDRYAEVGLIATGVDPGAALLAYQSDMGMWIWLKTPTEPEGLYYDDNRCNYFPEDPHCADWGSPAQSGTEATPSAPASTGQPAAPAPSADPSDATAKCADGTYSYSQHRSGTCSHHGGVAYWINRPSSENLPRAA